MSSTVSATLAANTPLRLRGRTPAGDRYYACCIPNTATTFWVRSAWVNIANNTLPAGAPSDADPNNPSWLAVQPIDPILVPRPTPTGIPLGDFPLAHYDAANSGRVPSLPNAPLQQSWTNLQQAAQAFVSPVAVSGASVLASSQDNQYYSLDLGAGTQRWRYNLQNTTLLAPAIQDGLIYLVFGGRSILSLQDQGNSAGVIWQSDLPQNATSPFTAWLDTLFIGAGDGGEARLIAIRRSNPAERREFGEPNSRVLQPAIGQETLFVGADRLWAIDANLLSLGTDLVWTSPDVVNIATPPVYAWPGVVKLAELYVADSNGTVHALDANTGVRFWTNSPGFGVTALAVNDTSVILAGNNGVLRALSRRDGSVQWTQAVGGLVMGGPYVTNTRVLAVTQGGGIFLLDAASGAILDAAQNVQSQVPGGPAVSGLQVIVPTSSNSVYAFRGCTLSKRPGWDSLLLAVLVIALIQITGLAEQAALPTRLQDVLRHPILGSLLPPSGIAAMGDAGPRPGDPVGLVLVALSLGLLLLYLLLDLLLHDPWRSRVKALILACLLATVVFLPMTKLILLRQGSGPASYTHDGGVIQTEATIRYLFEGKNPYVEDYINTPMAEWGISRYRTALYHYPYLPWTFLVSAPFYALGQALGFYDQRLVYALLWIVALALVPRLTRWGTAQAGPGGAAGAQPDHGAGRHLRPERYVRVELDRALASLLADLVRRRTVWQGSPTLGTGGVVVVVRARLRLKADGLVLCAILRPAAARRSQPGRACLGRTWAPAAAAAQARAPALLVFAVIVGPYLIWDAGAMYDDIWRWSSGQGDTGYQIWGWGASNFVLALGWVADRFGQWPFWLVEVLIAVPLLAWFLWRQLQENTLANACWHYGLLLFGFFYVSRFLNENYLGYLLAFLAIGMLATTKPAAAS